MALCHDFGSGKFGLLLANLGGKGRRAGRRTQGRALTQPGREARVISSTSHCKAKSKSG